MPYQCEDDQRRHDQYQREDVSVHGLASSVAFHGLCSSNTSLLTPEGMSVSPAARADRSLRTPGRCQSKTPAERATRIASGRCLDDDGKPVIGEDKQPVMRAKYPGLHALRHFYCSWCAARPQDGGLGLPLKTVQVRMGHSTLAMTADTYGHLFPSQDEAELLAAGEAALMRASDLPARATVALA
jgi:hypothetical protein